MAKSLWVILLDTSGSMGSEFSGGTGFQGHSRTTRHAIKLEAAKARLLEEIRGLAANSDVSVVAFSSEASEIVTGNPSSINLFEKSLRRLSAGGGTNVASGLQKGIELSERYGERTRFLLISDGLSNEGEPFSVARQCSRLGIEIDVVLIDFSEEGENFVRKLVEITGGRVSSVESAAEFDSEVSENRKLAEQAASTQRRTALPLPAPPTITWSVIGALVSLIVIMVVSLFRLAPTISDNVPILGSPPTPTPKPTPSITSVELATLEVKSEITDDGTYIHTTQISLKSGDQEVNLGYGILSLQLPAGIKLGDSGIVRLTLLPDTSIGMLDEISATVNIQNHEERLLIVNDKIQIFPVMGSHLDGANFDILPSEPRFQAVNTSDPVVWSWVVSPKSGGKQSLVLEVFVKVVIDQKNHTIGNHILANVPLEIQVYRLAKSNLWFTIIFAVIALVGTIIISVFISNNFTRIRFPDAIANFMFEERYNLKNIRLVLENGITSEQIRTNLGRELSSFSPFTESLPQNTNNDLVIDHLLSYTSANELENELLLWIQRTASHERFERHKPYIGLYRTERFLRTVRTSGYVLLIIAVVSWIITIISWISGNENAESWNVLFAALISTSFAVLSYLSVQRQESITSNMSTQKRSNMKRMPMMKLSKQEVYLLLLNRFSEQEVNELIFLLNINSGGLRLGSLAETAQDLVEYMDRRGRLPELINKIYERRPDVF